AALTRYTDARVKAVIRAEANDKCMYCESKVSHVFPGETDHIVPVSKRPDLVVAWDNLGYVCKECNREKGNYYDDASPLINPFTESPSDFLQFLGPAVFCIGPPLRGQLTISKLKLQRMALVQRRTERLEYVLKMIQLY